MIVVSQSLVMHIDRLMQKRRNTIINAPEYIFCIKPSI